MSFVNFLLNRHEKMAYFKVKPDWTYFWDSDQLLISHFNNNKKNFRKVFPLCCFPNQQNTKLSICCFSLQTIDYVYVASRRPQDNLRGPHAASPQTWWPAKKKPTLQRNAKQIHTCSWLVQEGVLHSNSIHGNTKLLTLLAVSTFAFFATRLLHVPKCPFLQLHTRAVVPYWNKQNKLFWSEE